MENSDYDSFIYPYENHFDHITDICRLFLGALRDSTDNFAAELGYIVNRVSISKINLPLVLIRERFMLNKYEEICLMFGTAVQADEMLGDIIQSSTGVRDPSFGMALHLYSLYYEIKSDIFSSFEPDAPMFFLLQTQADGTLSKRFQLKNEVFHFISGKCVTGSPFLTFYFNNTAEHLDLYPEQKNRIINVLQNDTDEKILIALSAGQGLGRRTLAARASAEAGFGSLFIEIEESLDNSELKELFKTLCCVCIMTNSIPIIIIGNNSVVKLLKAFPPQIKRVFLCSRNSENLYAAGFTVLKIALPCFTRSEKIEIWNYFSKGLNFNFFETADNYRLSISQISAVAASVRLQANTTEKSITELIYHEIGNYNTCSDAARIIHPAFDKDDLITDKKTKEFLNQICLTFKYRARLYEEAGYDKLFPYGRGIGVLFHGVSGTGKTMAAQVLGKKLKLGVMTVDLSRIMDKYIGETEKHLSKVFETAAQNNCILFFDEADSLFSKRTEVNDSRDRSANTQIAYLLQKMEEYEGLSVLATNLIDNIDEAFKRRLPFIIEFKRPDADLREILWRRFIPEKMPRGEIDYAYLSKTFELTPAVIKWAAFSAAVNAFADGIPLSTEHIIHALKYEYEKTGAIFPDIIHNEIVL